MLPLPKEDQCTVSILKYLILLGKKTTLKIKLLRKGIVSLTLYKNYISEIKGQS